MRWPSAFLLDKVPPWCSNAARWAHTARGACWHRTGGRSALLRPFDRGTRRHDTRHVAPFGYPAGHCCGFLLTGRVDRGFANGLCDADRTRLHGLGITGASTSRDQSSSETIEPCETGQLIEGVDLQSWWGPAAQREFPSMPLQRVGCAGRFPLSACAVGKFAQARSQPRRFVTVAAC